MPSFRAVLAALAAPALLLASCGGPTADEVDRSGGPANAPPSPAAVERDPDDGERDADRGVWGADDGGEDDQPEPLEVGLDDSGPDDSGPDDGGLARAQAAQPARGHAPIPDAFAPYVLSPNEMLPNAKRLASDIVHTLLTYEPQDDPREIVERVAEGEQAADLLVTAVPILHADAWSRGEVVYPQLGGFTETSASVMVVARQTVGSPDGTIREESRTFDVRLRIEDGVWVFDGLASAGGENVQRPEDLPAAAAAVVDDERIELPDTARWDIYRGVIDPSVLELMATMAEWTEYGVVVLDTGHPWEVFGTDRQSRHSMGRAVDLYRLDGPHVIDDRAEGSKLDGFVRRLYGQSGLANMGSPWALDGYGGRSFTDDLHQDHIHIEAEASEPS